MVLFKIRPAASGSGFSVSLKNIQGIIQRLVQYSGYYSEYELQHLVHYSGYYTKVAKVLFSVWFSIQGFIQNTTCSVCFRIQSIIKKISRVYFSVWFIIQGIIQNTTCSVWFRILRFIQNTTCSVWFRIQGIIQTTTCSVLLRIQGIIQKSPGYYSEYCSRYRVLFKKRPAASGSGFSVLLKNIPGIIQRLIHYSGYYSKYDLQRLVQDSAYYSKYDLQRLVHYSGYYSKMEMARVLFRVQFSIQSIIQNTTCSVRFRIQRIIEKYPRYYSASGSVFRVLFRLRPAPSGSLFRVLYKKATCRVWLSIKGIIHEWPGYF